uniref:Uncharacterized protein n=2 Tax=Guillardia theta TaxID=55529 RepID=A0A6U6A6G1_GUITH|mmetsp:Transcript_30169/g.97074  ORF Transcript_30169/g.97074 Transcript_30169/m.97074 type:complete len:533 (+) Transcript_30169:641-2239(+)
MPGPSPSRYAASPVIPTKSASLSSSSPPPRTSVRPDHGGRYLPDSLMVLKRIRQCEKFLTKTGGCRAEALDIPSSPSHEISWGRRGFEDRLLRTEGEQVLPADVREYLWKSFVARGGSKLMVIREELYNYRSALSSTLPLFDSCLDRLAMLAEQELDLREDEEKGEEEDGSSPVRNCRSSIKARRQLQLLRSCREGVEDTVGWLSTILGMWRREKGGEEGEQESVEEGEEENATGGGKEESCRQSQVRNFVAGEGRNFCLPKNFLFQVRLNHLKRIVSSFKPLAQQVISRSGWPPPHLIAAGKFQCRACGFSFGDLWVHRGVCAHCEEEQRNKGMCPYSDECNFSYRCFCPHSKKCIRCEDWSCDTCRLHRLDGAGLVDLVRRLPATRLFLDFDQTLCSSKSGFPPVPGKHRLQEDVAELLRCAQRAGENEQGEGGGGWERSLRVSIVSRNPHKKEIMEMLQRRGIGDRVEVCCVKVERTTKVGKIADDMRGEERGAVAVYADDDVRELIDPTLTACSGLHRVIFSFRELTS